MSQRYSGSTSVSAASMALNPALGFTVCGWLYVVGNPGGDGDLFYLAPSAAPGSANSIRLGWGYSTGPTLRWRCGFGGLGVNYTQLVAVGAWHHMAVTYDGATAIAYLDGAQVATASAALVGTYDTCDIGAFGGGAEAECAQIKLWSGVALTAGDLANEIAYWTPQTSPGSVYAWWQQEASAPTLDSSGHSHTLSGPGSADGSFEPPGSLSPTVPEVAAVGGTTSSGAAVVKMKLRVQAIGQSETGGTAWQSTSVPSAAGGGGTNGGRFRRANSRR